MDRLSEKLRFTIKEASELGVGSVRQIRYKIKEGKIRCFLPWGEGTKRERRWIPRSELVRMGILLPLAEASVKLGAVQILKMREVERHLWGIYRLKERLESELWLPPLSYLPARDLSVHSDTYNSEHTIHWTDAEDGLLIIKLPVESEDNFICLRQHTEGSKFWQHLPEWKQLGGLYIRSRSILLGNIREDIQTDSRLPTVVGDATRGVLEGFSWVVFRNLFPQIRPDERKGKQLAKKAIALASEGRWKEAILANRDIIRMFPTDIDAPKRLGKALIELQRYISAKEAYSRALEIDPQDTIAQKKLKELLQKYKDDTGIVRVDGGRYRVVSRKPDLWLLAVFTDDEGENIASVYSTEIDLIITAFQKLLRKYRASSKIEAILESKRKIDQLEWCLFQELKAITLETLGRVKCDGCPI